MHEYQCWASAVALALSEMWQRTFFSIFVHLFPRAPGEGSFQIHVKEAASLETLMGGSAGHQPHSITISFLPLPVCKASCTSEQGFNNSRCKNSSACEDVVSLPRVWTRCQAAW